MQTSKPPSTVVTAPTTVAGSPGTMTAEEREFVAEVLGTEYGILMSALNAAWSVSLTRTSLFLGVLSAAGVGLGFAAQGGGDPAAFRLLALVVLPLVLFLGVATFVRLVQVQRESVVYITGMNRIRHFFQQSAPALRRYFVLPIYDDERALYRSIGTGMRRRPPRFALLYLVVQTQGIVGIVSGFVAAALAALVVGPAGITAAVVVGGIALVVTVVGLFVYWQQSLAELRAAMRPLHPTPPEEVGAPF